MIHLTASHYSRFPLPLSSHAFLNMHALLFFPPTTLQNSDGCPLLLPLFSSAMLCNSALFVVDPISRLHPSCCLENGAGVCLFDRQTGRQTRQTDKTDRQDRQTDRHKRHTSQLGVNASALPIRVPTHSHYKNSLTLFFSRPNPASFVDIR